MTFRARFPQPVLLSSHATDTIARSMRDRISIARRAHNFFRLCTIAGALLILIQPGVALAQTDQERFERTLEQLRLETDLSGPREAPAGQRMLFDYGGYFIFDYIS